MKYRKRPVVIEAFRWTGGPGQTEDPLWIIEAMKDGRAGVDPDGGSLWLKTLTGIMTAFPGDYIIRGGRGEIYPCKAGMFDLTYEEAPHDPEGEEATSETKVSKEEMLSCIDDCYMSASVNPYGEEAQVFGAIRSLIERTEAVDALIEAAEHSDSRTARVQWALDALAAMEGERK